jgi:hypothetical protein
MLKYQLEFRVWDEDGFNNIICLKRSVFQKRSKTFKKSHLDEASQWLKEQMVDFNKEGGLNERTQSNKDA